MKRLGVFLWSVLLCLCVVFVMWQGVEHKKRNTPLVTTSYTDRTTTTSAPPEEPEPDFEDTGATPVLEWVEFLPYSTADGTLVLVDSGYVALRARWSRVEDRYTDQPYRLQQQAYLAFCKMMQDYRGDPLQIRYAAAAGEGCPPVSVSGTYASGWDLCLEGQDESGQAIPFYRVAQGKEWLYRNCVNYGFVACAQGAWGEEAGHFRYVGTPHAYAMSESALSLSSYLALLRCLYPNYESSLLYEYEGVSYATFYVMQDALGKSGAWLPPGARYTVSGDNRGGVVITVRKE